MKLKPNKLNPARRVSLLGLFFAVALVLSVFEAGLPPLAFLPPGAKLGLANIAVMYCLVFLGMREALMLAVAKAFFVFLMRGGVSWIMSGAGSISAVLVMAVVFKAFGRERTDVILVSIIGAITFNMAQLLTICILFANLTFLLSLYLPLLVLFGAAAGFASGTLLKLLLPILNKTFGKIL